MYQKVTRIYELVEGELKEVAPKSRIMDDLLAISVTDNLQINLKPRTNATYQEITLVGFNMVMKALATGGNVEEVFFPLKEGITLATCPLGGDKFTEQTDDVSINQIDPFIDDIKGVIQFHHQ